MTSGKLFEASNLGSLSLSNRVVMAPLTRARASIHHVPTDMMATYYAQRADCGLIVSEATAVDPLGMGWFKAPGIWTEEMVEGWKRVTDKVHDGGGRIVCQLWHMGRLVLPDYLNGEVPIGPSAIAGEGETFAPRSAQDTGLLLPMKPYVVPREMEQEDIDRAIESYAAGARNALQAGFDGVEIHAANGYLIDQFLQSKTNVRQDRYGGSVENRARFLSEVVDAVISNVEPGRVGMRVSPTSERKGMGDENPAALAEEIGRIAQTAELAYVHLIEAIVSGFTEKPEHPVMANLRRSYSGMVIQNGGFDAHSANQFIADGQADAISFGRPFIANPDLVKRMKAGVALSAPNFDYAYVGDEKGYIDYPCYGDCHSETT
ncbi:alkene reductase [Novosphingobium sp. FGD1]|uniref:Alkene reductase n=1 Tax=Novosphingobium silvae TaxID=2692619 RepID=A0A7X4GL04_9SPHN|nr:alkene reductase [Novosphingobium silvae]MYM00142.1 alkene reductase [Novosphingobium silvae]